MNVINIKDLNNSHYNLIQDGESGNKFINVRYTLGTFSIHTMHIHMHNGEVNHGNLFNLI